MSRRYPHNANTNTRAQQEFSNSTTNFPKPHKKFIPKNQNPNPNPTLSNSLRQSHSDTAPSSSGDGGGAASSRVRMGDDGGWVPSGALASGSFVNYLPQDEAVAAGLGAEEGGLDPVESQRVVDLLNRELSRLLKLNPRQFWKEVASDTSLHEFLDSFLKFRSRWYDFPHRGAKAIVAGVIVGEIELSRRVFMVLYRISSNKDPGARAGDTLSSKDHAVLLQEKKLLDLPKLLDICAIYGRENGELTGLLVRNALKAQPGIYNTLTAVLSHFLGIIDTMHRRCISSLEVLFSSGSQEEYKCSPLQTDFLEVMDFINDAIVSMDAFVDAYRPAAVFFSCPAETSYGTDELLITLAKLHDTLIPSLQQGFQIILAGGDNEMISNIAVSLKMLSMRLIELGWKLLDLCYLSSEVFEDCLPIPDVTKMFPAKVEDPVIRADILIQTLREIGGVPLYSEENRNRDTFLQSLDEKYNIMSRLQSLQSVGWIFMDDEQLQYLSGVMISTLKTTVKEPPVVPTPVPSKKVQLEEDAAIIESKISQIKDLFTDYGKGFIAACLEVYDQNHEEVIQRILEGTLHEDLQHLDTSLEIMPVLKSTSTVSKKDKGKGKLVESATPSSKPLYFANSVVTEEQQIDGPSVSSSSTAGRFVRKSIDMPDNYTVDTRDEKDAARKVALMSQYEYEDEYDDSFDDLGFSVAESGLEENEILSERVGSNLGKSTGHGTQSSAQTAPDVKWQSRKKTQFYVKDGKNYSYKVAGSVAVANSNEALMVSQAQGELIYGLGRGGNIPAGATKKWIEYQELLENQEQRDNQSDEPGMEVKGNTKNPRGRGRRAEGRHRDSHEAQNNQSEGTEFERGGGIANTRGRGRRGGRQRDLQEEKDEQSEGTEVEGGESRGNTRGRGRRGRGGNHYRKDRAMNKHFSGVSGF